MYNRGGRGTRIYGDGGRGGSGSRRVGDGNMTVEEYRALWYAVSRLAPLPL